MKLNANPYIIIGGVGLVVTIIFAITTSSNPSSKLEQKVENQQTIEKMAQDIAEVEAQISGLNSQLKEAKEMKRLLQDNLIDYCESIGVECGFDIPAGALGKVDNTYMDKICEHGQIHGNTSPLCNNEELYNKLENISKTKGVDFGLMLGIAYAESHIGANYKPTHCSYRNNWAGMKGYRKDGVTHYGKYPDNDCWIYHFKSYDSFWGAFAETLKDGYIAKECTSPECISQYWVGGQGGVKHDRVARVRMFFENDTLVAKK